jgi:hypothetical protein
MGKKLLNYSALLYPLPYPSIHHLKHRKKWFMQRIADGALDSYLKRYRKVYITFLLHDICVI